jgi:hypothetical protein
MHSSDGDHRPTATEPDPDALLRMRVAVADAVFVAEGMTIGLLLKRVERAPSFDDLPPRVGTRHAPDDRARVSADR